MATEALLPEETQTFLNNEIKKYNLADEKIAELKKQYFDLKISGIDDKENYKAVTEAIAVIRPLRTAVEKKRKELNEVPIAYKKAVDDEAKRLTAQLEEIENKLKEEKEAIDTEKDKIKQAEIQAREEAVNGRIHLLIDAGCIFNGTHYEIGEGESLQRVSVVDVRNLDDETFKLVMKGVDEVSAIVKAEIAQKQEAERLESERLEKEKAEFQKQQEAQAQERLKLDKEKAELEAQQKEVAKQLYTSRAKQLQALDYQYIVHNKHFSFKNQMGEYVVTDAQVETSNLESWNVLFQEAASERIRLNDLQTQKTQQDEAKRLEGERLEKEKQEQEAKEAEKQAEALRVAQLPDIEKCKEFFTSISNLMNTPPTIQQPEVNGAFQHSFNLITGAISQFNQKFPLNETN